MKPSCSSCPTAAALKVAVAFVAIVLVSYRSVQGQELTEELKLDNVLVQPRYETHVPAEASGRIREVMVVPGDHVAAGQVLAEIDPRAARLEIATRKAELSRLHRAADDQTPVQLALKSLAVANKEWERARNAANAVPRSVSQAELDRLQLAVDRLEIELQRAHMDAELRKLAVEEKELELKSAELKLAQHQLTAVRPGVVAEQIVELGEWVEAGQPVFRILTISKVRVEGLLPSGVDAKQVLGADAEVTVHGHAAPLRGSVHFVAPERNKLRSETRFWVLLDNAAGDLRPGDQGSLRLILRESVSR